MLSEIGARYSHLFTQPKFIECLYIPGTFLGTGNLQINKTCFLSSRNVQFNGGKRHRGFPLQDNKIHATIGVGRL